MKQITSHLHYKNNHSTLKTDIKKSRASDLKGFNIWSKGAFCTRQ